MCDRRDDVLRAAASVPSLLFIGVILGGGSLLPNIFGPSPSVTPVPSTVLGWFAGSVLATLVVGRSVVRYTQDLSLFTLAVLLSGMFLGPCLGLLVLRWLY